MTQSGHVDTLLIEHTAVVRSDERRAELKSRIKQYEEKYKIKSRSIHAAIDRGELKETQDVCRWIMDYELLRRATARTTR